MAIFDPVTRFANPPTNYIGSTIFLSYIAFALYLTITIGANLLKTYQARAKTAAKNGKLIPLSILALASFATLSYHMLSFLITSYTHWTGHTRFRLSHLSLGGLGRWMLETSLFESFGKELVRDGPSASWTQIALLGTWFWNLWIASAARGGNVRGEVLVPYVALGQILPISFTSTLYALYDTLNDPERSSKDASPTEGTEKGTSPKSKSKQKHKSNSKSKRQQASPPASKRKATRQPQLPKVTLVIQTIIFNGLLLLLPSTRQTSIFIPLVLATRLALLLPYMARQTYSVDEMVNSGMVSCGFVVAHVAMLRKGYGLADLVRGLRFGGEATKALSWDALLGVIIAGVLV